MAKIAVCEYPIVLTGASHTFIFYETDEEAKALHGLAAGKDKKIKTIGLPLDVSDTIRMFNTRKNYLIDPYEANMQILFEGSSAQVKAKIKLAKNLGDGINDAKLPYNLTSQNSNSMTATLLMHMGLELPIGFKYTVPGFSKDLRDELVKDKFNKPGEKPTYKRRNAAGFLGEVGASLDEWLDRYGAVGDVIGDLLEHAMAMGGHVYKTVADTVDALWTGLSDAGKNLLQGDVRATIASLGTGVITALGAISSSTIEPLALIAVDAVSAGWSWLKGLFTGASNETEATASEQLEVHPEPATFEEAPATPASDVRPSEAAQPVEKRPARYNTPNDIRAAQEFWQGIRALRTPLPDMRRLEESRQLARDWHKVYTSLKVFRPDFWEPAALQAAPMSHRQRPTSASEHKGTGETLRSPAMDEHTEQGAVLESMTHNLQIRIEGPEDVMSPDEIKQCIHNIFTEMSQKYTGQGQT